MSMLPVIMHTAFYWHLLVCNRTNLKICKMQCCLDNGSFQSLYLSQKNAEIVNIRSNSQLNEYEVNNNKEKFMQQLKNLSP